MTYCVAISVDDGLVFCSDSRTNAGPDMLFAHSKMHVYNPDPDRVFVLLTAGNLATTQAITARLEQEMENGEGVNLAACQKMIEAAQYVSLVSREEQQTARTSITDATIDTSVSLILGGQIRGCPAGIFMMYSAGNFISDSDDTPFLQIGENKYGKPILDRILSRQTSLGDAARCAVISMDSTLKSNATVGPPIEVLVYKKDSYQGDNYIRMEDDDPYLQQIRTQWDEALKRSFGDLPMFQWEQQEQNQEQQGNVLPINQDTV